MHDPKHPIIFEETKDIATQPKQLSSSELRLKIQERKMQRESYIIGGAIVLIFMSCFLGLICGMQVGASKASDVLLSRVKTLEQENKDLKDKNSNLYHSRQRLEASIRRD